MNLFNNTNFKIKEVVIMLLIVLLFPFFYVSAGELKIENKALDKLKNDSINVSIHTSDNVNIYIVPGTVTSNLVENPSVKITNVNDVKKKRIKKKVKKRYTHQEDEKIPKTDSSGKESESTIARIIQGSKSPNSYSGLKDSQDVIVPVSVSRIKIIEFNSGYGFIGYYFQFLEDKTWGYGDKIKILNSINDASHVRPPPFQIFQDKNNKITSFKEEVGLV